MTGFNHLQADGYKAERERMVRVQIADRGITDTAILAAMRKVPRHQFIPSDYVREAYGDNPVPIGHGQTISQPYIVAFMTEAVWPAKNKTALEVGTGSGYQAAILAEIVRKVFSIEIIPELATESEARLKGMGYANITVKQGDGYKGWPEHAPFDIVVVTAAAEQIPPPLIDQLAEGGRLVIPVGAPMAVQELLLLVKRNGRIITRRLTFVRFVPFKRL